MKDPHHIVPLKATMVFTEFTMPKIMLGCEGNIQGAAERE